MSTPRFTALLLLLLVGFSAHAANLRFQHLQRADGLSQSYVYSVVQDQTGYLWFGTQDGLNRFDGYDIRVYTHDPDDPTSLGHNSIRDLLVDSTGRLWVATDHGGLSLYDVSTDGFTHFRADTESGLATDRVRTLIEAPDGQLWIGTDGAGVQHFNPHTATFVDLKPGLIGQHVWALAQGADNQLWIGTTEGLFRYHPSTDEVTGFRREQANPHGLMDDQIRDLMIDSSGTLWVATDQGGLYRYAANTETFMQVPGISHDTVTSLFEDNSGSIWIGTVDGLHRWAQGKIQRFANNPANPFSISHNTVMSIFQDEGDVLWVGTYNGVSRWNQLTESLQHFTADRDQETSLSDPTVASMATGPDGSIWIGTFGGGLNVFDSISGQFKRYRNDPGEEGSLPDDRVMALAFDANDQLWVGTRAGGLARFNPATEHFERFEHDPADSTSISADSVTSILPLQNGALLIGTYTGGLNLYDGTQFHRFRHVASNTNSLSSDRVLALYQDSAGQIWIGTHGSGLNRFDLLTRQFTRYQHSKTDPNSLSGDNVLNIIEDDNLDLWVGTQNSGLNRWRAAERATGKPVFRHFTEASGLAGSGVLALQIDGGGNLWLASNNGLTQLDPDTEKTRHFDVSHGLQGNEFNHNAATRDGAYLYFGGTNGFNRFDPAQITANAKPPETVITSLAFGVKPVTELHRHLSEGVVLNHNTRTFDIRYAGLDYAAPELNRYQYQLVGLQDTWVDAGKRRYASFTNLAPGEYTFKVRSANNSGVWGDPARFQVIVHPAPWLSWWAYTLYTLFVFTIAASIYFMQRRKLKHAKDLLIANQKLANEITARRANEAALSHEKNLTSTYLDIAEVVLLVMDREGTITTVNRKGREVFAANQIDIENHSIAEFLETSDAEHMLTKLATLTEFENGYYLESVINARTGINKQIMWRLAVLPGDRFGQEQLIASGMDVTEERKLERVVQLREKLAAVGTMASGIAHDFNNILTAIYGYGQLSLKAIEEPEKSRSYIGRIISASERASDLIARLQTFTRNDVQEFKAFNPTAPILEACALLRGSLPAGVEVHVSVPEDLGAVMGDASQLHQVMMNLGTNAARAMMDEVGEIDIKAELVPLFASDIPPGSSLTPGVHLRITVADTGVGMNADVALRIFEPFYTTQGLGYGDEKGSGLGLSVVHGIVEAHKGTVDVRSMPGIGSTFTVYLPLCNRTVSGTVSDDIETGHKLRIILIDDEPWVADICEQVLTDLGHTVEQHSHPMEALVSFRKDPQRFDLVVTDQNLPAMKGTRLISEMRALVPDLNALVISGNSVPALKDVDFLQKPFDFDDLERAILNVSYRQRVT